MSMSVRLMRPKKLCYLWFAGAAHRDSEGEIGELAIFGFNRNAIDVKKDQCCCSTSPFIPINEWKFITMWNRYAAAISKGNA